LLAITLTNEADEILAHAAFFDYPNVTGVDAADWVEWLNVYFSAAGCNSLNTVFMHYFVSKPDYSHGCARELVHTMFNAIPDVHYCILVAPVGVSPGLLLVYTVAVKLHLCISTTSSCQMQLVTFVSFYFTETLITTVGTTT